MKEFRTDLAVDFDGVIRDRDDAPMEGVAEALRDFDKRYKMIVFTARHDLEAVHLWLVQHHMRQFFHEITNRKPNSLILDDKAWRFVSWEQAKEDLL